MSTFPKHDVLGSGDDAPPPREPIMDRLTVPPLSEQDPCYGQCARCPHHGEVYPVGSEWLCYRCAEGSAT